MNNLLILSGKDVSKHIYNSLRNRVTLLKENGITPGLAAILIGNDPASVIYIKSKSRIFNQLSLFVKTFKLPKDISQNNLIKLINDLNDDTTFHGILVQLPLPNHINSDIIINTIKPEKDVDAFHPENVGLLTIGRPRYIPCTPKGIMCLLEYYKINLNGKHVVVLGRSNIVGRPISILTSLKSQFANATTTICHSGTKNIEKYTKNADVIIVALGVPEYLKRNMVKDNVIIIDVGINRIDTDNKKGYKIVGDILWKDFMDIAKAVTPVPGGVGPMTIAMLAENTIEAAENY